MPEPHARNDIYHASELPLHHRDPFDRLLVAVASGRGRHAPDAGRCDPRLPGELAMVTQAEGSARSALNRAHRARGRAASGCDAGGGSSAAGLDIFGRAECRYKRSAGSR